MIWRVGSTAFDLSRRALVLGVVNVTPDSFSDGGRYASAEDAVRLGRRLVAEGADLLDVGGESTRPGAKPVSREEEWSRIAPVLEGLRDAGVPLSVDTRKADVAQRALAAGASIVNDVSGLADPGMAGVVAKHRAALVLMHLQGTPQTMQEDPRYGDVVAEVASFLRSRADAAVAAGVRREAIALDPGFGFGKTTEHNLALARGLPELAGLGRPLVVGFSRKSMLGFLTGRDVHERVHAGVAAAALAIERGARVVRTHDVAAAVDARKVAEAFLAERGGREPSLDRISVRGMRFHAKVGHLPEERKLGHDVSVDVDLYADLRRPGRSDRLEDAPDYAEVFRRARAAAQEREYVLLEALAERIADSISDLPASRVVVRVRKPHPPFGGPADHSEVEIRRP
ncbi:MAG TPA: dihydropteroate synthase [Candidatus Thermoplasmatota archaeon]|nr:dihydropteroate synthase [Candidatus Thermoplasmatota archaeon]